MTKTRLICLLLAMLMVTSLLASCANNEEDKPDDTGSKIVTDAPSDAPVFEEADFGGAKFNVLTYGSLATDFVDAYIWSDGISGGAIGDAVAERNRRVSEKYNVEITAEECGPMGEAVKRMQAGQCDFSLIYEWGIRSKSAALDGLLLDFYDLDYIDLDRDYWVPSATEDLTVAGRMFIGTNYITMNSFAWADMYFFNKGLMDKFNYDYPYEHVYDNTWTIDTFLDYVIGAEEDVNGDGVMDGNDQFAVCGFGVGSPITWSGHQNTTKNSDGSYTLSVYTEQVQNIYEKYSKTIEKIEGISYEDVWDTGYESADFESQYKAARFYIMGEDHALFMSGTMDETVELINMKGDYGVVPQPKYESSQENYVSGVDTCAPMLSIPVQVKDLDMEGMILEYMAYESENTLLPAFYDTTIKTKRMEDAKDYDMLDIVRKSARYDWTSIYLFGSTTNDIMGKMLAAGNFASVYKRFQAKAQGEIDDVIDQIESINY